MGFIIREINRNASLIVISFLPSLNNRYIVVTERGATIRAQSW